MGLRMQGDGRVEGRGDAGRERREAVGWYKGAGLMKPTHAIINIVRRATTLEVSRAKSRVLQH